MYHAPQVVLTLYTGTLPLKSFNVTLWSTITFCRFLYAGVQNHPTDRGNFEHLLNYNSVQW